MKKFFWVLIASFLLVFSVSFNILASDDDQDTGDPPPPPDIIAVDDFSKVTH